MNKRIVIFSFLALATTGLTSQATITHNQAKAYAMTNEQGDCRCGDGCECATTYNCGCRKKCACAPSYTCRCGEACDCASNYTGNCPCDTQAA